MKQLQKNNCHQTDDNVKTCSNIVDCILFSLEKNKNEVAQINCYNNEKLTFDEINRKVQLASYNLLNNGIKYGDVVAICSANNINYCWQILAILNTGAICSLLNPASSARELQHSLNVSKPKAVVCYNLSDDQLQVLHEAEHVESIWVNNPCENMSKSRPISELLNDNFQEDSSHNGNGFNICPAKGSDAAFILSSSGSTGLPKGVQLTHNNVIALFRNSDLFIKPMSRVLGLLPFYHAYGFGILLMSLYKGAQVIVMPKFNLDIFKNIIMTFKVSQLHIVPSLLVTIAKNKEINNETLASVQEVFTAASGITPECQKLFLNKLPLNAKLFHGYGMTETTFMILIGECMFDKLGSSGKLVNGITAKIIGEDGSEINKGTGELCVKGSTIMAGYYGNAEATKEVFDEEHWLHTGDLAYMDQDGYFFIVDRIKEMIKYQGYQISPVELEMVLLTHPGVKQAAVIGQNHELYGEVPTAYVVRNSTQPFVTEHELKNLIANELSPFKQLRGGVHFVDSLPTSSTGKILRKYLKKIKS